MSLQEMISLFSLERIGPSPSRFDHEKLTWLNGQFLQAVAPERLLTLLEPFGLPARDRGTLERAVTLHLSRCRTLCELAQALRIYGDDPTEFEAAGVKKFGKPELMTSLRTLASRLAAVEPFVHVEMEEVARVLAAGAGVSLGSLAQPARLALTGSLASPPLFEMIEVLGKETTLRRMLAFADRIEGRAGAS
jgi:glutamyl-tRNA synthetase